MPLTNVLPQPNKVPRPRTCHCQYRCPCCSCHCLLLPCHNQLRSIIIIDHRQGRKLIDLQKNAPESLQDSDQRMPVLDRLLCNPVHTDRWQRELSILVHRIGVVADALHPDIAARMLALFSECCHGDAPTEGPPLRLAGGTRACAMTPRCASLLLRACHPCSRNGACCIRCACCICIGAP